MSPTPLPLSTQRRIRRQKRVLVTIAIAAMFVPVAINTRARDRKAAAEAAAAWGQVEPAAPASGPRDAGSPTDGATRATGDGAASPGKRHPHTAGSPVSDALERDDGFTRADGGIVRGPRDAKRIALTFTGHEFAEGGETILDALAAHRARASFFLTGVFLRTPAFAPLVQRMVREGHLVGPHSDQHLLLCPWTGPKVSLVTRAEFDADLRANVGALQPFGIDASAVQFWLPSFEWHNADHVAWSRAQGLALINFTPGTRSNADYMEDGAKGFVSSEAIVRSILRREQEDPDGLKGFILLLHVGAGPRRTDKMAARFAELLDALAARGYTFVRVDDLLTDRARGR